MGVMRGRSMDDAGGPWCDMRPRYTAILQHRMDQIGFFDLAGRGAIFMFSRHGRVAESAESTCLNGVALVASIFNKLMT